MRLSTRLRLLAMLLGGFAALAAGAATGMALGERASRPGHDVLVIADPALATGGPAGVLVSAGGFTGFDGPGGLTGAAVRTGEIGPVRDGTFEVTSAGSSLGIRLTSPARLFRLRRATDALRPGDAIVVRVDVGGTASGVLRVPRDLNEGTGRPTASPAPSRTPR